MLSRLRQSTNRDDKGFTLIELLVVMIIIGILAAIAIPVFLSQRERAVEAGMKSDLRTVANELETYFVDNQSYPADGDVAEAQGTTTVDGVAITTDETATIVYTLDGGGAGYCLVNTNTAAGDTFAYDSLSGGLQGKGDPCV